MQIYNNSIRTSDINDKNEVRKQSNSQQNFQLVLNDKINANQGVLFSKHANMRLDSRNINLSNEQIKRVEDGISKARAKGINDSLVLVDNVALVVNVKNKTVITAMSKDNENIFTNIDGAVIV